MGKMPKKNGFVMYMETRRPDFLAQGHRLEGGLRDLAGLCAAGWQELPESERKRFTEDAKSYNQQLKIREAEAANQEGSSQKDKVTTVAEEFQQRQVDTLMLIEENRDIVIGMFEGSKRAWISEPIVLCSFTVYVNPGYNMLYLPAEIGLTAMSIKDGVIDNFARIIDPGSVPMGYGIEAHKTCEELGLPELGTNPELANYEALMMTMENFLQMHQGNFKGEGLYLFAFDSDFMLVSHCLEWLFQKTNHRIPVKVLSLDLYGYLASSNSNRVRDMMSKGISASVFCQDPLSYAELSNRKPGEPLAGNFVYCHSLPACKFGVFMQQEDVERCIKGVDNYKYYEELCCMYHVKNGVSIFKCALNTSNRYAFSLLEILTQSNEVPIKPGVHFPELENSTTEKNRRYGMLARWGITALENGMKVRKHEEEEPETPPGCPGEDRKGGYIARGDVAPKQQKKRGRAEDSVERRFDRHRFDMNSRRQEEERQGPFDDYEGLGAVGSEDIIWNLVKGPQGNRDPHPFVGSIPIFFNAPKQDQI